MSENAENRQEILELLANGKITASEASNMLAAAGKAQDVAEKKPAEAWLPEREPVPAGKADQEVKAETDSGPTHKRAEGGAGASWLRVRVSDTNTGKNKVTVNVPLRLLRYGLAIGRRYAPELKGLDWDEINGFLGAEKGMLVDVLDEEDGEHVQVFVD
jgi:hypothetical protein